MRSTVRSRHGRRFGKLMVVTAATLGLVAAACSSDKDSDSTSASSPATTAAAVTTTPGATTTAAGGGASSSPATTGGVSSAPDTTTASSAPAGETPKTGGELVMAGDAEVANPWTPAAMQCDPYCYQRARTFFDSLTLVGTDKQVHPFLAESVTPNADYTQWAVKLRQGIKFTDGTDLNADAAIRNLQETGSSLLNQKVYNDIAKNADGSMKIEKTDELSFTIYTGKDGDANTPVPWANLGAYLSVNWGMIASPKWLDEVKVDPTKASIPVGTGPFIVQSYAPRDSLVVTRNPNYWMKDANGVQLPYLDKITFKVIEDSKTSEQALDSGDIGIFSTSRSQIIQDYRDKGDDFGLREQSSYGETYYLLLDLSKEPVSDKRVRCAMSKAIDRDELNELTAAGLPKIANGLFSPGQEGYLEDNGLSLTQDIDGAKQLIDEYKQETGKTSVDIDLGTTPDAITQQAADLLKGYFNEAGINATIVNVPQDQYITNALFGTPDFMVYQWRSHAGYYADSQNLWWNSNTSAPDGSLAVNFGRLQDPDVDANLSIARSDTDPAKRQAAAEAINRTFAEECYQIPLSWQIWGTAYNPDIKGFDQATTPDGTTLVETGKTTNGGIVPVAQLWVDNG